MAQRRRQRTRVLAPVVVFSMLAGLVGISLANSAPAAADTIVYRVNAGGASVAGSPSWGADTAASPSPNLVTPAHHKVSTSSAAVDTSDASLPSGTPAALFQSDRWDPLGKSELTWSFPATAGSQYEVRLYFAETYAPLFTPGARVFDVELEGQVLLDDFDIYAQAGAGNKGIMRSTTITATGAIDLRFLHGTENPKVSAIEIIEIGTDPGEPTPASPAASPLVAAFPSTQVGSTAVEQITVRNDAPAGSESLNVTGATITGAGSAAFNHAFSGPIVLTPGGSTTFDVTFAPGAPGTYGASLALAHDAAGSPLVISLSGTATAASEPPGDGQVLFRVNAGGAEISGTPAWTVDTASTPSLYLINPARHKTSSTSASIDLGHPSVPAGTPAELFQTERWDPPGRGELTWAFPTTPGQYQVRLYFAETYAPNFVAGARVFDIELEGAVVTDDFDPFVAAGGGNKGVVQTYTVAADTDIDLRLLHVTENPTIKAIEILAPGSVQEPEAAVLEAAPTSLAFGEVAIGGTSSANVTLTNGAASGAESLDITGLDIQGGQAGQFSVAGTVPTTLAPGASTTIQVSYAPTTEGPAQAQLVVTHTGANPSVSIPLSGQAPAPGGGTSGVLHRVNAGGPEVAGDPVWSADTNTTPSPFRNVGNIATTASSIDLSDPTVPPGTPTSLFQTERWDSAGGAEMAWTFPTTPGEYTVRLFFAETYAPNFVAGARVFDVAIEGQTVLDDFDQFVAAGAGNKGVVRSFTVVADNAINIDFLHVTENPSIKAIEIVGAGGSGSVASLSSNPASLGFGNVTVGSAKVLTAQVRNAGAAGAPPLQITGTTISGSAANMFTDSYDDGSPVTLGPGQSTSIDVTFAPPAESGASASLVVSHSGVNSPLVIPLSGTGVGSSAGPISFGKSPLQAFLGAGGRPTTLEWGPDGRLYVGRLDGTISIATVERQGPNDYVATNVQDITSIKTLPNHDDDGTPNPSIVGRMVTGLAVTGTAQNPEIYLVSSDPRIGSPATGDLMMDTNSGVLSKLAWNGTSWVKTDLIRGFPRSKEQHSVQSITHLPESNDLLLFSGGNTNHGAPSANFQNVPEYALSAAILKVDLDALGASTYNLPTLDDEDRPGVNDANDPFGGNNGKNQAKLVPGGPVSVYASGLRNAYDGVMTDTGLYTIDNGGNFGWGGMPQNEGPAGVCTDNIDNTGPTVTDTLHRITGPGYYGGHPNPTRGNLANTFNTSNPQSPVSVADPRECDWIPNAERGALAFFPTSTNGMDQYTTTNFGGSLDGDLLAAAWDNKVYRVDMSPNGLTGTSSVLFSNVGAYPLDVIASDQNDPFPGTIWVADYGTRTVYVYEPGDYGGGGVVTCTGANDPNLDEDEDGYTNADEILNGTDPCSAGDVPADFDNDNISNLLDTDDDNDGIPDAQDPFAIDPGNGLTTPIPQSFPWDSDTPLDSGILNLGMTGMMTNGVDDWLDQFDPENMTVVGAAGVVSVDALPSGDALGPANTQQYAFQIGVDARPTSADSFEASTSLPNPFGAHPPLTGQSWGLQVGTGTQDDYVKVVVAGQNGGEMQLVREVGGVAQVLATQPLAMPGPVKVDVFLWVDPDTTEMRASFTSTGTNGVTTPRVLLGDPFTVPASWFQSGFAVGLIGTSAGAASPANGSWDFLRILDSPTPPSDTGGGPGPIDPPPPPSGPEGTWQALAAMPRSYEATGAAELDGYIYVAGGGCQGSTCGGFHRRYDPASNTWAALTPLPVNISHLQVVEVGGLLYYVGGLKESDDLEVGTVYIYNPATNSFTLGAPMPPTRARGASSVVVHGGKIYVAGGIRGTHSGQTLAEFDVYDPGTNTWTALPAMPRARDHVHGAVVGDKLYLIGGRNSPSGLDATVNLTDVFDFTTGQWSTLPAAQNIPTPRSGAATVAVCSEIMVLGGELTSGVPAAVEAFNTTTGTWRSLTSMVTPRHGLQAVHCNGGVYLAGGSLRPQFSPTTTHDVLKLNGFGVCPKP